MAYPFADQCRGRVTEAEPSQREFHRNISARIHLSAPTAASVRKSCGDATFPKNDRAGAVEVWAAAPTSAANAEIGARLPRFSVVSAYEAGFQLASLLRLCLIRHSLLLCCVRLPLIKHKRT